jgi:peptide/nickel transport system ATP-binding protein
MTGTTFLEVRDLVVEVDTGSKILRVLDGVSFSLEEGKTLGIVGESGCGKSMMALSIMRLLPDGFRIASGQILLDGEDITGRPDEAMRALRGNDVAMIFQEPMTSLNPVFSIGEQICEPLMRHLGLSATEARAKAIDMLRAVQIPAPEARVNDYPHQLSGGMRQRVMIAMALACRPRLIIADEPTTALDVTVQAQIFTLLRELQGETGAAIILITHDLGAVAEMADDVAVFYAGKCVESGTCTDVLARAAHPYTRGLMASTPRMRIGAAARAPGAVLSEIPGVVPPLEQFGAGCRFAPRCAAADTQCVEAPPPGRAVDGGHEALCWKPVEGNAV